MRHNIRDSKGRFIKQTVEPVQPTTPRRSRRKPVVEQKVQLCIFVLDKSGSMLSVMNETQNGFNEVLEATKASAEANNVKTHWILAKFGEPNNFELGYYNYPITRLEGYYPRDGQTALNKAIIDTIDKTVEIINQIAELKDAPVTMTFLTDGQENSNYALHGRACEKIAYYKNLGWMINFIGAGSQAYVNQTAEKYGFDLTNVSNYTPDSKGTRGIFQTTAASYSTRTENISKGDTSNRGFFQKTKTN